MRVDTQAFSAVREQKIAAGLRAARDLAATRGVAGIYLGGSLVAGLGNMTSDVDLFVVCEQDPSAAKSVDPRARGIDISWRSLRELEALCQKATRIEIIRGDGADSLRPSELDDLIFVLNSHVAMGNSAFDKLISSVSECRDAIRRLLIHRYARAAVESAEDLWGSVLCEDLNSALHVSYSLVVIALQAYLAGCGDLYVNNKWVWTRVERTAPELASDVERLLWNPGRAGWEIIAARMIWVQALLTAAQVDGWTTAEATRWTSWLARPPHPQSAATLDMVWMPVRYDDAFELNCMNAVTFDVAPLSAAIFGAIQALGQDQGLVMIADRFGSAGGVDRRAALEEQALALRRRVNIPDPARCETPATWARPSRA